MKREIHVMQQLYPLSEMNGAQGVACNTNNLNLFSLNNSNKHIRVQTIYLKN